MNVLVYIILCLLQYSRGSPPRFGLGHCQTQTCEKTSFAIERGENYLNALTQASQQESLIDLLWGNACHTRALSKVSKDCRELHLAEKSRLALLLMYCQLIVQGESRTNARLQCNPEEPLKFCVNRLTDRENALYIEMLSNIDTICLYIQNQEFEKYAEHMLNLLMSGSSSAAKKIQGIQRDLNVLQSDLLRQRKIQEDLNLNTTGNLLAFQHAFEMLQTGLHSLMRDVSNSFDQIKQDANEVVEVQKEIKKDITTTFMYTQGIFASIQEYQEKTDRTLAKILGSSYNKADFLFYGSCILSLFIMSSLGISNENKFLFMFWCGSSLVIERNLSQYGANTWWLKYIPEVKGFVRKALALLIFFLNWTRKTYVDKRRVIHPKGPLKDCVFCTRTLHPGMLGTRKAFSEIVLPTARMVEEQDEIQSPLRVTSKNRMSRYRENCKLPKIVLHE